MRAAARTLEPLALSSKGAATSYMVPQVIGQRAPARLFQQRLQLHVGATSLRRIFAVSLRERSNSDVGALLTGPARPFAFAEGRESPCPRLVLAGWPKRHSEHLKALPVLPEAAQATMRNR